MDDRISVRFPYYIHAPRYVAASAGVRALYILADALNRTGVPAWIVTDPYLGSTYEAPKGLDAPLLTPETLAAHQAAGPSPLVVYAETVKGNPLKGSAVVRFALNEPGLLGGSRRFPHELVYGYGRRLAAELGVPENHLFVPAIDPDSFVPSGQQRDLILFYADKFQKVHRGKVFGLPPGAVEITRLQETSPDVETLRKLLQRADRIYLFENTALAIEAPLSGCSAIMMPNRHLSFPIGELDHGMDGIAWGDSESEVARARSTVGGMRAGYARAIQRFPDDLELFVRRTQEFGARERPFGVQTTSLSIRPYAVRAAAAAYRMARAGKAGALPSKVFSVFRRLLNLEK